MNANRFQQITQMYQNLRIAVVGDFCLDRYLEIDGTKQETSIETGLPVHNIINIRAQPGGAGTVLSNLIALSVGTIYPVGFCGLDGEGMELWRALFNTAGVKSDYFFKTEQRRTFTYCKPLVLNQGKAPVELNRLDTKNWTPTPPLVQATIRKAIEELSLKVDAFVFLDQVSIPDTGVICSTLMDAIEHISTASNLVVFADSRQRLRDFPACGFKVNRSEFCAMTQLSPNADLSEITEKARTIALVQRRKVFVTLSEEGILGAFPDGTTEHVPALPVHGDIDIVGAGDAVLANLTAAVAAGASLRESLEMANAAASIVIHQLGTTGTAGTGEIERKLLLE